MEIICKIINAIIACIMYLFFDKKESTVNGGSENDNFTN